VLENTLGFFVGPLTLYRRHTAHLREVLPRIYRSVPVSVIYVAPNNLVHKIGFSFEREMLGMLEMRSKPLAVAPICLASKTSTSNLDHLRRLA